MAQYSYVRKDGSMGTVDANDSATALRLLPGDANPHSGVQAPLSGTNNPSPSDATLPDGSPSNLLTFAESLDAAMNLTRKSRNKGALDSLMMPQRGTLKASDFNDILGNLNAASDKTGENLIKRATKDTDRNIITATADDGTVTGIDKNTGEIVWQAPGVGNKQGGGGGASTLAERNAQAIASYSDSFTPGNYLANGIPTVDNEGFITPEAWRAAIAEAPSKGLTRQEFIKQFGYMITTQGSVSPKYGLTPVEQKLLVASGGVENPWGK